jgi:phosphatidylinositol alpha-1,6-mannosyltransferase
MAILVSNDFPPAHGGIQRYISRLANELVVRGEPVVVVAPQHRGSAGYDAHQHFRVLRYPGRRRITTFLTMTLWLLAARLGARNRYTIASMWFPAGLAACLLPRFLRGRLAVLAHGTEIAPDRGGVRRLVMRWVFQHADVIVANSAFTRGLLLRAGVRNQIDVVHLGIDEVSIAPARASVPTILSVGRLTPRKGFDRVIEALPAIVAAVPSARYEIVGDGPQRAELERLAQHLGVAAHVVFHGPIDDAAAREAYARAWCFALPVRTIGDDVEGFGLVYLEAALAGLPAIGGIRSGAEDAIVSDVTGLLVDGDSAPAVADAIRTLLLDPDRAAAMGANGRQRALEHFTWRENAAGIAALMDGAHKRPHHGGKTSSIVT